jgi:hypothetical protein
MYTAIAISLILLFARVLILKRMVDFPAGSYFASVLSKVLLSTLLCFAGSIPTRFFIFDYTTGKFIHLASCVCLSVVLNMVVIYLAGLNRSERTMMRSFIESKIRQK